MRPRVPDIHLAIPTVKFTSAWRAAALAIPDVGVAAFFIAGTATAAAGTVAPAIVLAAVLLSLACRTLDIEGFALPVRGGLVGRAGVAFGARAAATAAAAQLLERILFAGLVCLVFGRYVSALPARLQLSSTPVLSTFAGGDLASLAALVLLGFAWLRARMGYFTDAGRSAQRTWRAVTVLVVTLLVALLAALTFGASGLGPTEVLIAAAAASPSAGPLGIVVAVFFAFGHAFPAVGSGDSLARAVSELEPPRIRGVRQTLLLLLAYGGFVTLASTFLFIWFVPAAEQRAWLEIPLLGILDHLPGGPVLRGLGTLGVVVSGTLLLGQAARAGISGAERMLVQLAQQGRATRAFALPHGSLGTLARAIDTAVGVAAIAIVFSAGRVEWLAHAYAACLAWTILVKVTVLIRLRQPQSETPFRVPLNVRVGNGEWALGLFGIGALVGLTWLAMVLRGDGPTISATIALAAVAAVFASTARKLPVEPPDESDPLQIISSTALTLERINARPGGVLVALRNPHSLFTLGHAFDIARGRDIVVMTVRITGLDTDYDDAHSARPTSGEQTLFSQVISLAERQNRSVTLLVVPGTDVFDATIAAVLRLQPSDVLVGESATLSSDAQARLLGEAWERSSASHLHGVRLVVCHSSGRTDTYHLGAHDPTLSSGDLDLIHQLWLDASRALGPHVHHHDVVRAALKQMAEQLNGPERQAALQAIQTSARPGDELAGIVRTRDYTRLRDLIRNRPADHLATMLSDLSVEDQVVVFRLLPRKDAAATFEYLTHEQQEVLLKAMAQEDVAALLNEMAPDDRTMFLEELPAPVTRQLLALLTPEERAIASTLLGYPEGSIGRLMTPAYITVEEHWTIQQVLDYIRQHGQDSETLNVIYVLDAGGKLIDDIRIRELLLTSPSNRVSDLMDRQFVAMKATDAEETAISEFRAHDRTALPVTDTTGNLIGIVTIDDVLDVLETQTTEEIQRIGGSEALDEPYMVTSFASMVRKRAVWLTVLFVGEMLTATAMGAFEAEIERAVVLALFVPLIISSGGNSGSQASTLVIRALALGELTLRDWWRVAQREIGAGLALGGILGTIGFLRISIWSAFSTVYGEHWLLVAITVSIALVFIVLWGTLVGSLLPFLLRRLGFDPATSSAPFVATLVDVTGLIIYFTVALLVLQGTLL